MVAPGTPGGSGSDTTDGTSGDAPSGLHSQEEQQINITEAGPSTIAGTTLSDIEQQVCRGARLTFTHRKHTRLNWLFMELKVPFDV